MDEFIFSKLTHEHNKFLNIKTVNNKSFARNRYVDGKDLMFDIIFTLSDSGLEHQIQ